MPTTYKQNIYPIIGCQLLSMEKISRETIQTNWTIDTE